MIDIARYDKGWTTPFTVGCDACCYDFALVTQYEIIPIIDSLRRLPASSKEKMRASLEARVSKM